MQVILKCCLAESGAFPENGIGTGAFEGCIGADIVGSNSPIITLHNTVSLAQLLFPVPVRANYPSMNCCTGSAFFSHAAFATRPQPRRYTISP